MFKFLDKRIKTDIDFKSAKYCYHCGKELDSENDKCSFCGALKKSDSILYTNDVFGVITYYDKNAINEIKGKIKGKAIGFVYDEATAFFKGVFFNFAMSIAVVIGATAVTVGAASFVSNEVYVKQNVEKPYKGEDRYVVGVVNENKEAIEDIVEEQNEEVIEEIVEEEKEEIIEEENTKEIEVSEIVLPFSNNMNEFFGRYSDFLTVDNVRPDNLFANGDIGSGAYYDYAKAVGSEGLGRDDNRSLGTVENGEPVMYIFHGESSTAFAKLTFVLDGENYLLLKDEPSSASLESIGINE